MCHWSTSAISPHDKQLCHVEQDSLSCEAILFHMTINIFYEEQNCSTWNFLLHGQCPRRPRQIWCMLTGSNWLWWSKQTERQQVRSPARGRRLSFNGKIETETERGKYMIQSSDPIIQYSLDIPIFQWDPLWQCHHSNPGSLLLLHYCHYCPYCGHYFKFHQVYYIGLLVSLFSCVKASLVVLVFRFLLMVWIP